MRANESLVRRESMVFDVLWGLHYYAIKSTHKNQILGYPDSSFAYCKKGIFINYWDFFLTANAG